MAIAYLGEALTNIVAGLLLVGFGIIVGNVFSILTKKTLESFETEQLLKKVGIEFPIVEMVTSFLKYGLYLAGLLWGLTFLGIGRIALYIALLILLGLLILFILLSIKDFVPNFMAGVIIHLKKKVKEGEQIKIESTEGKVITVGLLETTVKMKDGDVVIIPNTLLAKSIIVKKRR